jgi:hypothetical protein
MCAIGSTAAFVIAKYAVSRPEHVSATDREEEGKEG